MSDSQKKYGFNIVVPMAGLGSRFADKGYELPKPLIDVDGAPMIKKVVYNLDMGGRYVFLVPTALEDQYRISELLHKISSKTEIVYVDSVTEGAAATTLLAKDLIDDETPLIIANCDQLIDWTSVDFITDAGNRNLDGSIAVFTSNEDKWSYAKTDESGSTVVEVAEKSVISDMATVGVYYWKSGSDYVKYAEQMIAKDIRTNGEFYVCPVYNEAIADGKTVGIFEVGGMTSLGTPEDLESYLLGLSD